MKTLHVSAECYPAAKAGGLGDVVGALPAYLGKSGSPTGVIIPKYAVNWINNHQFSSVYRGMVRLHNQYIPFSIERETSNSLGYPFFVANIPGKFDRPGIYTDPHSGHGYGDETERYLCFQQAVLQWIANTPGKPEILHCHDHHTGLIPFMVKHCPEYQALAHIPTVFTIHNGVYHGAFSWEKMYLLPFFNAEARGLLDWGNTINPLAAGIKCAWRVTTVSQSYLNELMERSNGMEMLFQHERHKSVGIINGIDTAVWNPGMDSFIAAPLRNDISTFKEANKNALSHRFKIDLQVPLITFIGRLVGEKGADLLPDLISRSLRSGMRVGWLVLGTGETRLHNAFQELRYAFPGRFDAALEYNEGLAHQLYAGADFLIMPSRVEPCGLNQMYAMNYGTIPIVRSVGGLRDTVPDIGEADGQGRGVRFDQFSVDDAFLAVHRALELYQRRAWLEDVRERIMAVDFSWEASAAQYRDIYNEVTSLTKANV